ncbi:MAG TPA: MBL fold metallo-hydrolase [Phycisphaerae bacterium]|nr:MBL fold metallo-hydrolase [Phycisphaerae bacterium]
MQKKATEFLSPDDGRIRLMFQGAAKTVTGSMHLLKLPDKIISFDCGLFQGRRYESLASNETFFVPAEKVDEVLLSHAHIDHSGRLPLLVKKGFDGKIFATGATCDLCEIMLADSGHIQEEDAAYWNAKRAKSKEDEIKPLYTVEDAVKASKHLQHIQYYQPFFFAEHAKATYVEAGHILGSACIHVEIDYNGRKISLLYTGDLGRFDMPILRDPQNPLPAVDYLITESTYAGRLHNNPTHMKEELVHVINETRSRGGKVIIPSFSVGRTQNVVYYLVNAINEGILEPLPIFVDSPLSTNATAVFKNHPECFDEAAKDFWLQQGDLFGGKLVQYITDVNASKALNSLKEPHVIIAAAGMCESGRILHHLKNNVEDENNSICIVGFMAQHTLGRRIVERRDEIKIFGKMYRLLARVEILNGFSSHADTNDFRLLLGPLAKNLKGAFVVHGEDSQLTAMKDLLESYGCRNVNIPNPGDIFTLE